MNIEEFSNIIKPLFIKEINYELSERQIGQFFDFMNLLIEENKKYNLTSIIEPEQIIYKHFLDSCELSRFGIENFENRKFIDIGCGAGFPSIPLAILLPNTRFLLVDAVNKKLGFIELVKNTIGLENIRVLHSRIEDLGHNIEYIEKYDYCTSRAVSQIPVILEYSSTLLAIGGKVFVYKLANSTTELDNSKNAIELLGFKQSYDKHYCLYSDEPERTIYSFEKISKTPPKYPRKAGIPSKSPL